MVLLHALTRAPAGLAGSEARRFVLRNQLSVVAIVTHASLAAIFWAAGFESLAAWSVAVLPYFVGLIALNWSGRHSLALTLALAEANVHTFVCAWVLGSGSGAGYPLFVLAFMPPVLAPSRGRGWVWVWVLTPLVFFLGVELLPPPPGAHVVSGRVELWLDAANTVATFVLIATVGWYSTALSDRFEAAAERSERRMRELLENLVPKRIAHRMLAGEPRIADTLADASVLFADLVGFTTWSASRPAVEVVERLGRIFARFDALTEAHGLEKVKTIGDAYMAYANIVDHGTAHTARLVSLGLALRDAVREASGDGALDVRIGVHAGPVVAGVLGEKRVLYDLWGDTVNTAARMESHGRPGAVHVSEAVVERVGSRFDLEDCGFTIVKGKGPMRTWIVLGERQRAVG